MMCRWLAVDVNYLRALLCLLMNHQVRNVIVAEGPSHALPLEHPLYE